MAYQIPPENPLPGEFRNLAFNAQQVVNGTYRSLVAYGAPGIGKTHTVMQVIEKNKLERGKDFAAVQCSTFSAFIQTLWEWRLGGVLVFDDADKMLTGNAQQANLMKAVLEPDGERFIIYDSQNARRAAKDGDMTKAHPEFKIECRVIAMSNLDMRDLKLFPTACRPHVRAIDSRVMMSRFSSYRTHCLEYVVWLVIEGRLLENLGYSLAVVNDVLEFFCTNAKLLDDISPRCIIKLARIRKADPAGWRSQCTNQLLPKIDAHDMRLLRTVPQIEGVKFNTAQHQQLRAEQRAKNRRKAWAAKQAAADLAPAPPPTGDAASEAVCFTSRRTTSSGSPMLLLPAPAVTEPEGEKPSGQEIDPPAPPPKPKSRRTYGSGLPNGPVDPEAEASSKAVREDVRQKVAAHLQERVAKGLPEWNTPPRSTPAYLSKIDLDAEIVEPAPKARRKKSR